MSTRRSKREVEQPIGEETNSSGDCGPEQSVTAAAAKKPKRSNDTDSTSNASQPNNKKNKQGQLKDDRLYGEEEAIEQKLHSSEVTQQVFGNLDICTHMFSFLKVRELYSLVMSHPDYMKHLTYAHVIRSAMLSGGYASISAKNLVQLVRKRSIFVPSPIRMLRLMNGKRCEKCNTNRANSVSQNYGVFYCSKSCGQPRNHEFPNGSVSNKAFNRKWGALLGHPRIATGRGRNGYRSADGRLVWIQHTFTTPGGEPYGPIVTIEHLNDIVETQKIRGDEEKIAKLNEILQTVDAEKNPHGAKDAQSIVDAYESCLEDAKNRQQEIEDLKKQTNEAANNLREQKTRAWVDLLLAELGDVPWKEAVSTFEFRKMKHGSTKSLAKFTCPLVQEKLQELAAAPSKATKKKVKALAKELSIPFNKHYAHDLIGYLDDNDPFQNLFKTRLEVEKARGRLPVNLFMSFTKKAVEMMDAEQWVDVWDILRPKWLKEAALDYVMPTVRERFPDTTEEELRRWRRGAGYRWTPRFYILWRSHGNHENQDNGPFAERMPKFERDVVEMVERHGERARKDKEALQRFREESNP